MQHAASRSLMIASLLIGLAAAPMAMAGESHGYPQTTSAYESFSHSSVSRTVEESDGYGGWSGEESGEYGDASDHHWSREHGERYGSERHGEGRHAFEHDDYHHHMGDEDVVADNEVGYLPVSFFADAGGVGPYGDFGYGGGGGGFVYGGGFASGFAGAHASASASASASISIIGGFRGGFHGGGGMHGGYPHGGGHGCGCK
jgi:hypothetical protein